MKREITNEYLYEVLLFIKQFHKQYGYCPSIREICDGMEIKITRKRAKKLLENT